MLGEHEAVIRELVKGQERIEKKVDAITTVLAERTGERRAGTKVAVVASFLVSTAVSLLGAFWGRHK